MPRTLTWPALMRLLLCCSVLVALTATSLVRLQTAARRRSQARSCQCNLRHLDAMCEQWAYDHRQGRKTAPQLEDLRGYSKGFPTCPAGGNYVLGPAGTPPRCTLGDGGTRELDDDHVLQPVVVERPEGWVDPDTLRKLSRAGLVQLARSGSPFARSQAALRLWKTGGDRPTALVTLLQMLNSADPEAQSLAASHLGELGPPARAALPTLRRLLKDEQLRSPAVSGICRIGPDALTRSALAQALAEPEVDFRVQVLEALGNAGASARDTFPAVAHQLEDPAPQVRKAALAAVYRINLEAALPYLQARVRREPDMLLQYQILDCIRQLGPRARPAASTLRQLVRERRDVISAQAAEILHRL